MLRKLRPRSVYDVMAAIACFGVLAGGTAYAANTIRTGDIVDNEVTSPDVRDDTLGFGGLAARDLGPGSVGTSEVANGSLNDEDVGEGTSVDFELTIGTVPGGSCALRIVGATGATGDHLLLTPNTATTSVNLIYGIEYSPSEGVAWIKACNLTSASIDDGTTRFNLLVFDAH